MTISTKETTSIKLDVEVKAKAKEIFKELGITMGEAVNIFLSQVALHKGLPFEVKIPNDETRKAIEDARRGINMEKTSIEEMIAERENIKNA
jgi:DNA-damage-inducible protein J